MIQWVLAKNMKSVSLLDKVTSSYLEHEPLLLPAHFDDVTEDILRLIKPNLVKNTTGAP